MNLCKSDVLEPTSAVGTALLFFDSGFFKRTASLRDNYVVQRFFEKPLLIMYCSCIGLPAILYHLTECFFAYNANSRFHFWWNIFYSSNERYPPCWHAPRRFFFRVHLFYVAYVFRYQRDVGYLLLLPFHFAWKFAISYDSFDCRSAISLCCCFVPKFSSFYHLYDVRSWETACTFVNTVSPGMKACFPLTVRFGGFLYSPHIAIFLAIVFHHNGIGMVRPAINTL